jgi:hypothetical protein
MKARSTSAAKIQSGEIVVHDYTTDKHLPGLSQIVTSRMAQTGERQRSGPKGPLHSAAASEFAIELIGRSTRASARPRQQGHRPRGAPKRFDPRHRRRERRRQVDADVDPLRLLHRRQRRDPRQRHDARHPDSRHALALGIGMVHQHFMLVDPSPCSKTSCSAPRAARCSAPAWQARAPSLHPPRQANTPRGRSRCDRRRLSVGLQQRVEILKALYRGADVLILDEPTAC